MRSILIRGSSLRAGRGDEGSRISRYVRVTSMGEVIGFEEAMNHSFCISHLRLFICHFVNSAWPSVLDPRVSNEKSQMKNDVWKMIDFLSFHLPPFPTARALG